MFETQCLNILAGKMKMNGKSVYFFLGALLSLLLVSCNKQSSGIALGTLERDRIAHTATVNEVVVALPIAQGDTVKVGDVLVQLDDRQQSAIVAMAKAHVTEARVNLEKLRNGARVEEVAAASAKLEGARAALRESSAAYIRVKNLINTRSVSQAELDQATATKDANAAAVEAAREDLLILTNGTRPEDLKIAEANLAFMLASLESELKKLEDLTIKSTREGILDNLPWNLGERVTTGSPVAIVLAGKAPYARIYVPEPYRINLSVGDSLSMRVDGLANIIEGKVRWISSEPAFTPYYALNQEERARLMYLAEVQLPDSYRELASGVPLEVALP